MWIAHSRMHHVTGEDYLGSNYLYHCYQKQIYEKAYVLSLVAFMLKFVIFIRQVLQPRESD